MAILEFSVLHLKSKVLIILSAQHVRPVLTALGMQQSVQFDKQDIVFAGAGDEVHWVLASFFDGMKALSTNHNDNPQLASRPFDANRDGFVISGGGVVVLEEYEHASAREAGIFMESLLGMVQHQMALIWCNLLEGRNEMHATSPEVIMKLII